MRLSCNGCRVLRKGCTPDCPIRECLLWIPSPQSQSNATLFLAKFYGRAGLLNLLNSGGDPRLRPSIFKSLLYDACGRIVNPIFGSSGLLSSGSWHLCQAAVQAVLRGDPITQVSPHSSSPLLKSCDIRHVDDKKKGTSLLKVKNGGRFKRAGAKPKAFAPEAEPVGPETTAHSGSELDGSSGLSEHSSTVETAEVSPAPAGPSRTEDHEGLELELTMWWGQQGKGKGDTNGSDDDTCRVMLDSD